MQKYIQNYERWGMEKCLILKHVHMKEDYNTICEKYLLKPVKLYLIYNAIFLN